jgi:hypothetical protein
MSNFWQALIANWKTTTNGFLAFLIATATVVMAFTSQNPDKTNLKISSACAIVLALCRAYVGLIQKDADKVLAKVPGQAQPQVVAAHPVPDNPADKAVLPASSNIGGK